MLGAGLSLMLGSWAGIPHGGLTDWDPSGDSGTPESPQLGGDGQGGRDEVETANAVPGDRCSVSEEEIQTPGTGTAPREDPQTPKAWMLRAVTHPDAQKAPGTRLPCPHFFLSPCTPEGETSPFSRTISTCLCSSAKPPLISESINCLVTFRGSCEACLGEPPTLRFVSSYLILLRHQEVQFASREPQFYEGLYQPEVCTVP